MISWSPSYRYGARVGVGMLLGIHSLENTKVTKFHFPFFVKEMNVIHNIHDLGDSI